MFHVYISKNFICMELPMRRSCASLRPRHTVRPEHKKTQPLAGFYQFVYVCIVTTWQPGPFSETLDVAVVG